MTQETMGGPIPLKDGRTAAPSVVAGCLAKTDAGTDRREAYRYAVYFAPEDDSTLARFGGWWLGRRPTCREFGVLPKVGLDSAFQTRIVTYPRQYGFHATLKAPFRLVRGASRTVLREALADFAEGRRKFVEPPLELKNLDGFLALVPSRESAGIAELAGACVRELDSFRSPLLPEEIERRRATNLTPYQEEALLRWGYPFVFDSFCFHMTLTGHLGAGERETARNALAPILAQVFVEPVVFASVCLFEQAGPDTPFVLTGRFPFGD